MDTATPVQPTRLLAIESWEGSHILPAPHGKHNLADPGGLLERNGYTIVTRDIPAPYAQQYNAVIRCSPPSVEGKTYDFLAALPLAPSGGP